MKTETRTPNWRRVHDVTGVIRSSRFIRCRESALVVSNSIINNNDNVSCDRQKGSGTGELFAACRDALDREVVP
jgi:hypothetical protein